jgi:nitrite reductase/ring-hydroxylating ferredoxin subunit
MASMLTFRDMSGSAEWRCAIDALRPGATAKFRLECGGRRVNGFMVNHDGDVHAYVNRCPHVGTPLDLWENEFLSEDTRRIICATHGAVFDPATGHCTSGPCVGDSLRRLPVTRDGDALVVTCPA